MLFANVASETNATMKAKLLIAAIALVAPTASFADHRSNWGSRPYCPPSGHYSSYGHYPSYGYYAPSPIVSFTFGSRPSVYTPTRYYVRSSSSLEASVQRALRREGYYDGAVDGDIGPRSRAAIRDYQAENGLAMTGRIDSRLLRSLGI